MIILLAQRVDHLSDLRLTQRLGSANHSGADKCMKNTRQLLVEDILYVPSVKIGVENKSIGNPILLLLPQLPPKLHVWGVEQPI